MKAVLPHMILEPLQDWVLGKEVDALGNASFHGEMELICHNFNCKLKIWARKMGKEFLKS